MTNAPTIGMQFKPGDRFPVPNDDRDWRVAWIRNGKVAAIRERGWFCMAFSGCIEPQCLCITEMFGAPSEPVTYEQTS